MTNVLIIDRAGVPKEFVTAEEAVAYFAKDKVMWSTGSVVRRFHGGFNAKTGDRTIIDIQSVMSVGDFKIPPDFYSHVPPLNRETLLKRDRGICCYCGKKFSNEFLTKDHVLPVSKGGADCWTNVVTACCHCNHSKANFLLSECGMEMLYLPYAPNRWEAMILNGRKIVADQMEFLLPMVSKNFRQLNCR